VIKGIWVLYQRCIEGVKYLLVLRDATLIPLSHQHQSALALCVISRRTLAADPSPETLAKVAQEVIDRFDLEIRNHFEIEEQVLFPACGGLPILAYLIAEHRAIESLVADLRQAPTAELLLTFFSILSTHIRREERELFEEIQITLPREVLDRAGAEIGRRAVRVCI
jgi:hemerythrin-like domain-containing protein